MEADQRFAAASMAVMLLVLAALTVWLYVPALSGPLLLDDTSVIAPLLNAGQEGHDWRSFLFSDSGPLGRPLAMASFIANAVLNGPNLRAWKATNLVLHLINGGILFALVATLVRANERRSSAPHFVALGATALWLVHPLLVSTVMYLCQRMTELATLFTLLGMLSYAQGRLSGADTRYGRLAIATALLVCAPLAALSKEVGLLTPFYLAALEATVFRACRRPRWLAALMIATTALPLAAALLYIVSHWHTSIAAAYSLREFGPLERVLTEARIVLAYSGWIIAPRRSAFGFYHDDIAITHGPLDITFLLAATVLTAVAMCAWRCRARAPLVAFGIALLFIGHALESTVFPLELAFEHRNYLPAAGLCVALAAAATHLLGARRGVAASLVLASLYGLVTASMTPTWGNEGALYASFLRDHPRSLRARASQIEWLLAHGDLRAAETLLGQDADVTAQLHRVRIACLATHSAGVTLDTALAATAHAARLDDMGVEILLWLAQQSLEGSCALDSGRLAASIEASRDRPLPTNSRLRFYVLSAQLRLKQGDYASAAAAAATAAKIVPRDPYPLLLGAEIALDNGDRAKAGALLAAAREVAQHQHEDYAALMMGLAERLRAP